MITKFFRLIISVAGSVRDDLECWGKNDFVLTPPIDYNPIFYDYSKDGFNNLRAVTFSMLYDSFSTVPDEKNEFIITRMKDYLDISKIHLVSGDLYNKKETRTTFNLSDMLSKVIADSRLLAYMRHLTFLFDFLDETLKEHKIYNMSSIDFIFANLSFNMSNFINQINENEKSRFLKLDILGHFHDFSKAIYDDFTNVLNDELNINNCSDTLVKTCHTAKINLIIELNNLKSKVFFTESLLKAERDILDTIELYFILKRIFDFLAFKYLEKRRDDPQNYPSFDFEYEDIESIDTCTMYLIFQFTKLITFDSDELIRDLKNDTVKKYCYFDGKTYKEKKKYSYAYSIFQELRHKEPPKSRLDLLYKPKEIISEWADLIYSPSNNFQEILFSHFEILATQVHQPVDLKYKSNYQGSEKSIPNTSSPSNTTECSNSIKNGLILNDKEIPMNFNFKDNVLQDKFKNKLPLPNDKVSTARQSIKPKQFSENVKSDLNEPSFSNNHHCKNCFTDILNLGTTISHDYCTKQEINDQELYDSIDHEVFSTANTDDIFEDNDSMCEFDYNSNF